MFGIFKKYFDYNQKEINRLQKKVDEINALEDVVRDLKDEEFAKKTSELKKQIKSKEKTLDEILPLSFALTREAARRVLGERHYDVQIIAAIALHEGKIVEQKTGEGKTLSATCSMYLNALTEKGVHLVTVNDYLARRDCGWMGAVFHFLGLSTSAIISDESYIFDPKHEDKDAQDWRLAHIKPVSRQEAYEADITYGINSEFGFDYLRDNMAKSPKLLVQKGFHFAIIDEADSVLIDEARTPHIISSPYEEDTSKYYKYASIVKQLKPEKDYVIDEKLRTANLTEEGIKHIETMLGVKNIYEKNFDTLFHVEAALKANTLFKIDKEYIVKGGEVIIVDEFTGRLLQGRRFSEGLHQAIEAKEGVNIQRESKTLATVSLQNYFRMYEKLAGMTGTAATEAEEFNKIYKTDVIVIPTHKPKSREDHPDMIYKKEKGKFNAVVEDIAESYKKGRPVLVGTSSIEKNEYLSSLLKQKAVPHELLNAKNHIREAQIIAQAGKKGAITIATNMAGRGVDIVLGGQPPDRYETDMSDKKLKEQYYNAKKDWQKEHDEVVKLKGLYVIGTERHESRRIDNQLRGRSGRQGDPGETRFFVSLEDDLMRIFGGDQISKLMTFFNFPEDQPLTHSMVSKAIEQSQVKVEGFNFDIRKHLVDYDDVLNKQREIVYALRRKILILPEKNKTEFRKTILNITKQEVNQLVTNYASLEQVQSDEDIDRLSKDIGLIIPSIKSKDIKSYFSSKNIQGLIEKLNKKCEADLRSKEEKIGSEVWSTIARSIFLSTIESFWTEHLTAIDDLREGINLRAHAQMDPLVEYKNEAFSMFEKLLQTMNFEAVRRVFNVEVEKVQRQVSQQQEQHQLMFQSASSVDPFTKQKEKKQVQEVSSPPPSDKVQKQEEPPKAVDGFRVITPEDNKRRKIGRNDPCWCGSGKKYKKCHWPD